MTLVRNYFFKKEKHEARVKIPNSHVGFLFESSNFPQPINASTQIFYYCTMWITVSCTFWITLKISTSWSSLSSFQFINSDFGFTAYVTVYYYYHV